MGCAVLVCVSLMNMAQRYGGGGEVLLHAPWRTAITTINPVPMKMPARARATTTTIAEAVRT